MRLEISRAARRDLRLIWNFSVEEWGRERADRYIRDLDRAMTALAVDPRRARARDDLKPGYMVYAAGSHTIIARVESDAIKVVRMLRARMDFKRHL